MSRLEDFSARHSVEIKELYERANAARWRIPEAQWTGAIYRAAIWRESPASPSSQGREYSISSTSLHAQDFAFALAFRLGCGEAMDYFMAKYEALLHGLAVDITHDESRARSLTEVVFRELHGEAEEDGRRRSLFQDFDGRDSLVIWLRAIMAQRHGVGRGATIAPKYQSCAPCPTPAALAAYRSLVQLGGVSRRGQRLRANQRDEIRNHLRVCSRCQTTLVASQRNYDLSAASEAVAGGHTNRSTSLPPYPLRIAGIVAGIVLILTWAMSLSGEPQQLVSRAATFLNDHATGRQPRDPRETPREMPIDAAPADVGSPSHYSEPRNQSLTPEFRGTESRQSGSDDDTLTAFLSSTAGPGQLATPVREVKSSLADAATVPEAESVIGLASRTPDDPMAESTLVESFPSEEIGQASRGMNEPSPPQSPSSGVVQPLTIESEKTSVAVAADDAHHFNMKQNTRPAPRRRHPSGGAKRHSRHRSRRQKAAGW
jgi:hypothetical protein